jgi:hypothetical protein
LSGGAVTGGEVMIQIPDWMIFILGWIPGIVGWFFGWFFPDFASFKGFADKNSRLIQYISYGLIYISISAATSFCYVKYFFPQSEAIIHSPITAGQDTLTIGQSVPNPHNKTIIVFLTANKKSAGKNLFANVFQNQHFRFDAASTEFTVASATFPRVISDQDGNKDGNKDDGISREIQLAFAVPRGSEYEITCNCSSADEIKITRWIEVELN